VSDAVLHFRDAEAVVASGTKQCSAAIDIWIVSSLLATTIKREK
jgi:hypothetical protein